MALRDDNRRAAAYLQKVADRLKVLAKPNNRHTSAIGIGAIAETMIPYVSLGDGGKSRGRLAGIMKQLKTDVPEQLLRSKEKLSNRADKENQKDLSEGIREGLNARNNQSVYRIPVSISSRDAQLLKSHLSQGLGKAVSERMRELAKKITAKESGNDDIR